MHVRRRNNAGKGGGGGVVFIFLKRRIDWVGNLDEESSDSHFLLNLSCVRIRETASSLNTYTNSPAVIISDSCQSLFVRLFAAGGKRRLENLI